MSWIGTFVIGLCVGIILQNWLEKKAQTEETRCPNPVGELAGLAVEVLRRAGRVYWDTAAVLQTAQWLHEHAYTPMSDPDEIVPVLQMEC